VDSALDVRELRAVLVAPNGPYAGLDVVASTGSTNRDLAVAAMADAADRTVLIAEQQTAGQGRMRRDWVSPPRTGLYLSVLLRPDVPAQALSWLTLLAGVALVRTSRWAGADVVVKWPNDLLLGPDRRKGAGVLAEATNGAVVLGIGLNVLPLPDDVPLGAGGLAATSLADAGATKVDRTQVAIELLGELAALDEAFRSAGGDPVASGLHAEYVRCCATVGSRVRVELPSGDLVGTATDVDLDGTLRVRSVDGVEHALSAGDVVHLRAIP
jgi:BirA family biotin operon repressor/biotin-[acetyl-CoA-carboxylase] ligase